MLMETYRYALVLFVVSRVAWHRPYMADIFIVYLFLWVISLSLLNYLTVAASTVRVNISAAPVFVGVVFIGVGGII